METPLTLLRKRSLDDWLAGHDAQAFLNQTEAFAQQFSDLTLQKILITESDPVRFLAGFIAACSTVPQVFLGNPVWGESEWRQALAIVEPDWVLGNCPWVEDNLSGRRSHPQKPDDKNCDRLIMIPTGGSSGEVRFAMHRWQTLTASVEGFRQFFQLAKVNSICVLPLYHVSGLMQFMRSFLSGGRLLMIPYKDLKVGNGAWIDPTEYFISLVPTQLQHLLEDEALASWLSQCKTVLLGGAPSWSGLLDKARGKQISLAPCYGMTETASQIVTLKLERFLRGDTSSGQVLPHAAVKIVDAYGEDLACGQIGKIVIQASSLALGYYPEFFSASELEVGGFLTDDAGFLDSQGNLTLVGRLSSKIITGGENVFPVEVESAIRSTQLVQDVSVIGLPDPYWGQMLTAVYTPRISTLSPQQIEDAIQTKIARFKRPKLWISVEQLPRNAQGKINRKAIQQLALRWRQANSPAESSAH
ncbi:MAG: 2-succinylbenzoate--CoA ligase [Leptolyngbyaceae cyanobacterium MO_188.B28]|nr:2-succinylbenzoate--CoA ligase [Leptolyngbyaceae cyanobacterium MO_188.B28]